MLDAGNDDHPVTIRHEWDSYFPSSGGKWKWQDREGTFYGFLSKRHIILMIFIHFNIKNSESPAFLLKICFPFQGNFISFPWKERDVVFPSGWDWDGLGCSSLVPSLMIRHVKWPLLTSELPQTKLISGKMDQGSKAPSRWGKLLYLHFWWAVSTMKSQGWIYIQIRRFLSWKSFCNLGYCGRVSVSYITCQEGFQQCWILM